MSNFKIWIEKDLGKQALDKMQRISDKDMPFYEACVYQVRLLFFEKKWEKMKWFYMFSKENNQFYVTDMGVRLKLIVNPKKINLLKNQIQSSRTRAGCERDLNVVRINIKQYLYSSMMDFKSKKVRLNHLLQTFRYF